MRNAGRGVIAALVFVGCQPKVAATTADAGALDGETASISVTDLPVAKRTFEEQMKDYWGERLSKAEIRRANLSQLQRNMKSKRDGGVEPGDAIVETAFIGVRLSDDATLVSEAGCGTVESAKIAFRASSAKRMFLVAMLARDAGKGDPRFLVSMTRETAKGFGDGFDATKLATVVPERRDSNLRQDQLFEEEFVYVAPKEAKAWKAWSTAVPREMSTLAIEDSCQKAQDARLPDGATLPGLTSMDVLIAGKPTMSSRAARWESFYLDVAAKHVRFVCECDFLSDRCWTIDATTPARQQRAPAAAAQGGSSGDPDEENGPPGE